MVECIGGIKLARNKPSEEEDGEKRSNILFTNDNVLKCKRDKHKEDNNSRIKNREEAGKWHFQLSSSRESLFSQLLMRNKKIKMWL